MISTLRILTCLIFFLNGAFSVSAQLFSKENSALRLDGHFGYVIPEYKHFTYLVESPVSGFELSFYKRTTGKTIWESLYHYPEYGITLLFTSLGNDRVFGHELALYPYFQTFLIRKERFQLTNQFGLGLGYATKKFDLETNYENISVGSRINLHFNYKLGTRFKISDRLSANLGLSFTHYSNANMAEPNLGMNLFTAFGGMNYSMTDPQELIHPEIPAHIPNHEFAIIYAAGGKHTRALQSTVYFTSSLSLEHKYHWKRKFHFGGGLDLFFDSSTETEMNAKGNNIYQTRDAFRSGIHLSQELIFDRFSFIFQQGVYLGLLDKVDNSAFYNRGILRWKFNEHFLMHISMKSHLHILDYPELGFGYFFIKSK